MQRIPPFRWMHAAPPPGPAHPLKRERAWPGVPVDPGLEGALKAQSLLNAKGEVGAGPGAEAAGFDFDKPQLLASGQEQIQFGPAHLDPPPGETPSPQPEQPQREPLAAGAPAACGVTAAGRMGGGLHALVHHIPGLDPITASQPNLSLGRIPLEVGMTHSEPLVCTFTMENLPAAPERIFPLLCPIREAEWLAGWTAEMIWSRSGLAEKGAVFTTPGHDAAPWVWHMVQHDSALGRIQFSVTAPGSHLLHLALHLEAQGTGSRLTWIYTLHALSPAGTGFLAAYEEAFAPKMAKLQRRLRHWLTTGTMLPEDAA